MDSQGRKLITTEITLGNVFGSYSSNVICMMAIYSKQTGSVTGEKYQNP